MQDGVDALRSDQEARHVALSWGLYAAKRVAGYDDTRATFWQQRCPEVHVPPQHVFVGRYDQRLLADTLARCGRRSARSAVTACVPSRVGSSSHYVVFLVEPSVPRVLCVDSMASTQADGYEPLRAWQTLVDALDVPVVALLPPFPHQRPHCDVDVYCQTWSLLLTARYLEGTRSDDAAHGLPRRLGSVLHCLQELVVSDPRNRDEIDRCVAKHTGVSGGTAILLSSTSVDLLCV